MNRGKVFAWQPAFGGQGPPKRRPNPPRSKIGPRSSAAILAIFDRSFAAPSPMVRAPVLMGLSVDQETKGGELVNSQGIGLASSALPDVQGTPDSQSLLAQMTVLDAQIQDRFTSFYNDPIPEMQRWFALNLPTTLPLRH
jgi:hypothetical protein